MKIKGLLCTKVYDSKVTVFCAVALHFFQAFLGKHTLQYHKIFQMTSSDLLLIILCTAHWASSMLTVGNFLLHLESPFINPKRAPLINTFLYVSFNLQISFLITSKTLFFFYLNIEIVYF